MDIGYNVHQYRTWLAVSEWLDRDYELKSIGYYLHKQEEKLLEIYQIGKREELKAGTYIVIGLFEGWVRKVLPEWRNGQGCFILGLSCGKKERESCQRQRPLRSDRIFNELQKEPNQFYHKTSDAISYPEIADVNEKI